MTERLIRVTGGRCLVDTSFVECDLLIDDGHVIDVRGARAGGTGTGAASVQAAWDGADELDVAGRRVAPGLIDLQINGGYGLDLATDPTAVWELGRRLARTGVTAFLPTLITGPSSRRSSLLEALARRPSGFVGAEPIGAHFEGPILNPDRRGAHDASMMVEPSAAVIESWDAASGVRLVTLAPELPGALECIEALVGRGIVVFGGHTTADAAVATAAVDAGMAGVTHLFNAMASFGHRSPNLVGVALSDERLSASVIVDRVHVDPVAVRLAWRALGPSRFVLVTDAVAAMGQPAGRFEFADRGAVSDGRAVRNDDGTLAGSALRMDEAVRNLVEITGCTPAEAVASASAVPARLIGETDRGHLGVGARADIVVFDDDLAVTDVLIGGEVVTRA